MDCLCLFLSSFTNPQIPPPAPHYLNSWYAKPSLGFLRSSILLLCLTHPIIMSLLIGIYTSKNLFGTLTVTYSTTKLTLRNSLQ